MGKRLTIFGTLCVSWLFVLAGAARAQNPPPTVLPRIDERVQPATHLQPAPFVPSTGAPQPTMNTALPLTPRNAKSNKGTAPGAVSTASGGAAPAAGRAARDSSPTSWTTMFLSLGAVLGLFLGSVWLIKKTLPTAAPRLPAEVVEVLGCTPLASRQSAHLIRFGNKLLLVSLSQGGAETLTEITDPVEVDRIAGLCRAQQPQSASASFRSLLEQFGRERTRPGFIATGNEPIPTTADRNQDDQEDDDV